MEEYGIEMIPLKVTFENGDTYLDRLEIGPEMFAQRMMASKTLPKTAAPDPNTFKQYFENGIKEFGEVIFLSISSGLSSTYQTAQLTCNLLGTTKVKAFDTLSASMGTGIMAIKAAQLSAQGALLDDIYLNLTKIRDISENIFTLDTLANVVKGGRLSRVEGLAGTLLSIKPILKGINGKPEVIEKIRGRKKAIQRLLSMLGELAGDSISQRIVGVTHVDCPDQAEYLCNEIKQRYNPQRILIFRMSATIGTYAGKGALMINF
jgi:DegV family protein with EDD domain